MAEMTEPAGRDSSEATGAPNEPVDASAAVFDVAATAGMVGVLDQVRERGFITTGEIFAAFPDLEPDTDELRDLYDMFETRGVKVLDEIAAELELEDQRRAGSQPSAEPAPRRRATEAREHRPTSSARPGGASSARFE